MSVIDYSKCKKGEHEYIVLASFSDKEGTRETLWCSKCGAICVSGGSDLVPRYPAITLQHSEDITDYYPCED